MTLSTSRIKNWLTSSVGLVTLAVIILVGCARHYETRHPHLFFGKKTFAVDVTFASPTGLAIQGTISSTTKASTSGPASDETFLSEPSLDANVAEEGKAADDIISLESRQLRMREKKEQKKNTKRNSRSKKSPKTAKSSKKTPSPTPIPTCVPLRQPPREPTTSPTPGRTSKPTKSMKKKKEKKGNMKNGKKMSTRKGTTKRKRLLADFYSENQWNMKASISTYQDYDRNDAEDVKDEEEENHGEDDDNDSRLSQVLRTQRVLKKKSAAMMPSKKSSSKVVRTKAPTDAPVSTYILLNVIFISRPNHLTIILVMTLTVFFLLRFSEYGAG